ncbi:hypothetical protein SAMN05444411_105121 [Lutibacter oricola]|uniref:Uncharacterized protein n=1 Tax=Lutibacter oricola TaxID=762486 RepID=A0A1H3BHD3_9FLAO|nr:hypothetical protein [Lutibacter oricola]SDX41316.1 hypothetical protein SAMN05444411_105121 [Lutibacter oricola]
MENPFKKLLHNEEVPKVLREKVINDISLIKLSIDLADLFVVKYPNTIGEFLTTENEEDLEDENKEE